MAKKDKEAKASKKDKAETTESAAEFKYGVKDIAEKLGINEASVRVKLRNAGVKKAGKSYGWNSKSDMQEAIDEISSDDKPAAKKAKKADKDEKPAKKGKSKSKASDDDDDDEDEKPAKKSKKAKKAKDEDDDDDD